MQAHRLLYQLEYYRGYLAALGPVEARGFLEKMSQHSYLEHDLYQDQQLQDVYGFIDQAEKFEIPMPSESEDWEEIVQTLRLMEESDLIKLPYDLIYIETATPPGPQRMRLGMVVCSPEIADGTGIEFVSIGCHAGPGIKGWGFPAIKGRQRFMASEDGKDDIFHRLLQWFFFLMSAQGMSQVRYDKPEQLNKARLKRREKPIDGYTKVLLPGFVERVREEERVKREGGKIDERHRVRMHWRRGHLRQQAYGAGRALHKPIFIKPMLVGYEEEGRIYHLQYGQELTSANLE